MPPDKVKKTENMKAYQEEYRKTHKKDPVKNLKYMKIPNSYLETLVY